MQLPRHLSHLETNGLIRLAQMEPELEYIFRHALVQDATYQSMLFADRRKLHRQVGEALEQLYPDRLDELASTLAHHFALAEDTVQAFKYYTLAGDAAARSYANAEAINHCTRAVKIIRRNVNIANSAQLIHLYTQFGRICELNSDYDQALEIYREMEQLARQRQDRTIELAALMARATVYAMPSDKFDVHRVEALSQQALAIADELQDHEARARIHWNKMLLNTFTGDYQQALTHGETALGITRRHELNQREAYVLHDLARIYMYLGQPERAEDTMLASQALWRKLDNKAMLANSLSAIANQYAVRGNYDRALEISDEALALSQTIGNLWNQSYSQMVVGLIYIDRGQFSRAIELIKTCIDLSAQAEFMVPQVELSSYLGYIYGIWFGDLEQGFEWANYALSMADSLTQGLRPAPLTVLAQLHLAQGSFAQADKLSTESRSHVYHGTVSFTSFTAALNGEIALAQHDYLQAIEIIDPTLAITRQRKIAMHTPTLMHLKARALLAQKQGHQAYILLQKARAKAENTGSNHPLWQILATLSQIETQDGNLDEAANLCQQAREILDYIAAHIHPPNLRAGFLNQPNVHAVMEATNP